MTALKQQAALRTTAPSVTTDKQRAHVLAGIIILQALCALFFVADVARDFYEDGMLEGPHVVVEAVAALALVCGVMFLMLELRRLLTRLSAMDTGLRAARGQMAEVMDAFYEGWHLTAAERDIATMILKGLENDAIAQVRHTAPGTVRAQATSIYTKSGVSNRAQFISLFMEELMAGDFAASPDQTETAGTT